MSPANSGKKRTLPRRGLAVTSKRRKPAAAPSAAAAAAASTSGDDAAASSPPWASLHEDLVQLVAWRVLASEYGDYVRLRAACRHWRSSTVPPCGRGVVDARFHPRHWMLLPEGFRLYPGHTRLRGRVRFFNLRTGAFASVALPIFKDHYAMDSVDGLLLLQRDHDMAVRLFHPFTGDIVELPSLATLVPQVRALINPIDAAFMKEKYLFCYVRRVCAAVSLSPDDDGVVTVMLALTNPRTPRVAFATSEDQQWTLSSWESPNIMRMLSLQGKLYFLNNRSQVLMVNPPQHVGNKKKGSPSPRTPPSLPPPKLVATCSLAMAKIQPPVYLAECDSEILLLGSDVDDSSRSHIIIYRLADIILGRITPLDSIGDNSLFVNNTRSVCVSSKAHPSICGDSVVCYHPLSKGLGQYHLGSGTSEAMDGYSFHGLGPMPSPYSLINHIYTCCDRYYWNKGQIYCRPMHPTWGAKSQWRFGG